MRQFYWALIALAAAEATAVAQPADSRKSSIGYPTVASALNDLRSKSGVQVSNQGGWTVLEDRSTKSIWSFTPPGHPAHPAVVRRTVVERGGAIYMEMGALCEAAKPACDKLVAEFRELNNKIGENISKQHGH